MAEVFIEVNDKDKIIGALPEESFYEGNHIHRTAALLVLSEEGEVLIQKRKKSSKHYGGLFDFPAVAWVLKGETYDACVTRAMKESIGLDVHCVEAVNFETPDTEDRSFVTLYTTYSEGPFRLLSSDMDTLEWMSIHWLKEEMERRPDKFSPRFLEGIKQYFEKYGDQEHTLSSID